MKETDFIKQNKQKWSEFEKSLGKKEKNPEKVSDLFIQTTDDLSYSRTYYPNRSIRLYLNGVAQRFFRSLYKTKKASWNNFKEFWVLDLPSIVYESRKAFNWSFLVFVMAMGIGIFSTIMDPDYPRVMLSDQYVEMTEKFIADGDPMAVYKSQDPLDMFVYIAINNLKVDLMTFAFGLFFSIGSIVILIGNGAMVGAFQWFFIGKGLAATSFFTIWMHGAIEIPTIVISGAAGIVMGKGLVFPGTYTRAQSFIRSSKKGLAIFLGVIPFTIFAALIEGFATRYTDVPNIIRGLIIFSSLALIFYYFWWYPKKLAKSGKFKGVKNTELFPTTLYKIDNEDPKTNGEIFTVVFFQYQKLFGKLLVPIIIFASVYVSIGTYFISNDYQYIASDGINLIAEIFISLFSSFYDFFYYSEISKLLFLNILIFSLHYWFVNVLIVKYVLGRSKIERNIYSNILTSSFITTLIINGLLYFNGFFTIVIGVGLIPFLLFTTWVSIIEEINFIKAISRSYRLLKGVWMKCIGLLFLLVFVGLIYLLIIQGPFGYIIIQAIGTNYEMDALEYNLWYQIIMSIISFIALFLILPTLYLGFMNFYFTALEINEAPSLFNKVKTIGSKKIAYGLEKE